MKMSNKSEFKEIDSFVSILKANRFSKHTIMAYSRAAELVLIYAKKHNKSFNDLKPEDMLKWYTWISNGEFSYSDNSVRSRLNGAMVFCDVNDRPELLRQLIKSKKIRFPRKPKLITRRLTFEESQKLISTCKYNLFLEAMIRLFLDTGMREEDLRNLNLDSIDFETGKVLIFDGKGNKDRETWIDYNETLEAINRYIKYGRKKPRKYYKMRKKKKKNYEYDIDALFITREGTRPSREMIYKNIRNAGNDAGLDSETKGHVSPHCLRRTCARLLYLNGVPVEIIQMKLGHERLETTLQYIGDISDIAQERCKKFLQQRGLSNLKIMGDILN